MRNMEYRLQTLGHATMLISGDGEPLIATDPWLIGSNYWRSWWLEQYPGEEDIARVRRAREIYITHSHPDHFHWPSMRKLGPRPVLHPRFPNPSVAKFLDGQGYATRILNPWEWFPISEEVRIASVPVPIDDSVLIVETPTSVMVNINDSFPKKRLLTQIKTRLVDSSKRVIVLRSYSPASSSIATFRDGERVPLKEKADFVRTAQRMSEAVGGDQFVPFASQVFFCRQDSRWANEFKVTYEDLERDWTSASVELCKPFIDLDLQSHAWTSAYDRVSRELNEQQIFKLREREETEEAYQVPSDLAERVKRYFDSVYFLRFFFPRGVGFSLSSSGQAYFYRPWSKRVTRRIPKSYDVVITLPDQVLVEALQNGILTDLGITMLIRVDSKTNIKLTYALFLLMALRDYGYFKSPTFFLKFLRFYLPYLMPYGSPARRLPR